MVAAGWLSKNVAIIAVPIVTTLYFGLLIGWLGQTIRVLFDWRIP